MGRPAREYSVSSLCHLTAVLVRSVRTMWESKGRNWEVKSPPFTRRAMCLVPCTTYYTTHPLQLAVVFLPIWLSNLQRFVCFGIIKYFTPNIYLVRCVLSLEEIDRHYYSQLPAVRAVVRWRVDGVFVPAFGAAIGVHVGVWFRSSGGKWWSRGGNT